MKEGTRVSAAYVWTGAFGAATFLCSACCTRWRAMPRRGFRSVVSINAWLKARPSDAPA